MCSTSSIFIPSYLDMAQDHQGYTWPHYFYVRGILTVPSYSEQCTEVHTAPVTEENISDYVRHPTLLFRSEHNDFDT
jgi:hypothetical protein